MLINERHTAADKPSGEALSHCVERTRTNLKKDLCLYGWPVPGLEDTELGVFMEPEVGHGTTTA